MTIRTTSTLPPSPLPPAPRPLPAPPRWGSRRARYIGGLATIVAGVALTNLTTSYSLWFLAIGPAVQLVGWLVLPGALWRRIAVLLPCLVAGLVLIAGADFAGSFVVLLAGWIFARHRPPLSYIALLPAVAAVFLIKALLNEYSQNGMALLAGSIVTIGCAWLAAWLDVWQADRRAASAAPSASEPIPSASERIPSPTE